MRPFAVFDHSTLHFTYKNTNTMAGKALEFISNEEIKDIKDYDAWPIESFINHTNGPLGRMGAISGNSLMRIRWEDALWPNDGSDKHKYLAQRLVIERKKNKVRWVDTVLIGDQECTHVRWNESWVKLNKVNIQCQDVNDRLKKYCSENAMDYDKVKQSTSHSFQKV